MEKNSQQSISLSFQVQHVVYHWFQTINTCLKDIRRYSFQILSATAFIPFLNAIIVDSYYTPTQNKEQIQPFQPIKPNGRPAAENPNRETYHSKEVSSDSYVSIRRNIPLFKFHSSNVRYTYVVYAATNSFIQESAQITWENFIIIFFIKLCTQFRRN